MEQVEEKKSEKKEEKREERREKAGTDTPSTTSILTVDTAVSCRESISSAKTPSSELLRESDSPLSVMNLPREEHLLPDAPGRLPTPNRPPPPTNERLGI